MTVTNKSTNSDGVALVTGSSSGFGLLASIELARKGHRVFATMRNLERGQRLREAAAKAGVDVEILQLDVTDSASIGAAVDEAVRRAGRIDVLVNNAGFGLGGFAEDYTMAELREQFETNFFGLVELTKAVIPIMREQGSGRIINVSSIMGLAAVPGMSAYCASKFAVEGFSEALRHELLPFGIYVTLVEPGTFRTDIFERNRRLADGAECESSPNYERGQHIIGLADKHVERTKSDPNTVAKLIARAATKRRPRLRYIVGIDARAQRLLKRVLPSRVMDTVVKAVTTPKAA